MHQSTTPTLSRTIWPRWASRQFLSLPIVQTLLAVTFGGCRYETIETMKEAVTKVIDTLTQEDFHWAFHKLLELYKTCIGAGGDYFNGDWSFMCVLSIKVPIRKKSGNLFNDPRIKVRIAQKCSLRYSVRVSFSSVRWLGLVTQRCWLYYKHLFFF